MNLLDDLNNAARRLDLALGSIREAKRRLAPPLPIYEAELELSGVDYGLCGVEQQVEDALAIVQLRAHEMERAMEKVAEIIDQLCSMPTNETYCR